MPIDAGEFRPMIPPNAGKRCPVVLFHSLDWVFIMSIALGAWVERNNKRFVVSEINAGVAVLRCGFDTLRESLPDADATQADADDTTQADATQADAGESPQVIRIEIDASALVKLLQPAKRLVAGCIKHVLRNVAVFVDSTGAVEFHSTDMETYRIDNAANALLNVSGCGRFLVDVAALVATLSVCKYSTVLTWENGLLTVAAGKKTLTVAADDSIDEFPHWDGCTDETRLLARYETDAETLARLLRQTVVASDAENTRFALSGILLHLQTDADNGQTGIACVATDGKRLHVARHGLELFQCNYANPFTGILATHHAKQLLESLKIGAFACVELIGRPIVADATQADAGESPQADAGETKPKTPVIGADAFNVGVFDKAGESVALFQFRAVDGRFPRWLDVIPNGNELVATVDGDALMIACADFKRAKCIDSDGRGSTIFAVDADAGALNLESGALVGKQQTPITFSQTLPVVNAREFRARFDWAFLLDAATAAGGQLLQVLGDDENSALRLSAGNFDAVLMPLAMPKKQTETDAGESPQADAGE